MRQPFRKHPRRKKQEWEGQPHRKKQGTRREVQNRKHAEAMIINAKDRPCADCGVQYPPWIMELDHLDPKKKVAAVSKLKYEGRPPAEIAEEISKCEAVCSNCHKNREHLRKQGIDPRARRLGQSPGLAPRTDPPSPPEEEAA